MKTGALVNTDRVVELCCSFADLYISFNLLTSLARPHSASLSIRRIVGFGERLNSAEAEHKTDTNKVRRNKVLAVAPLPTHRSDSV